jgi:hypothetical protein
MRDGRILQRVVELRYAKQASGLEGSCRSICAGTDQQYSKTCRVQHRLTPNQGSIKHRVINVSPVNSIVFSLSHSQCPTNVAPAVPKAPQNKHEIPCSLIRFLNSRSPATPPCVCCVVLSVSIGVRSIRKVAEARDAAIVLTRTGQVRDSRRAKIPAFAAVSPKRERGPWKLFVRKTMAD